MHHSNSKEFLGVDVGDKKIGIARGSGLARIAEPLKTVAADKAIDEILALSKTHGTEGIIVGLPRSLDGADTAQTKKVRLWVRSAQSAIKQPFYWQDEALTSVAAEQSGAGKSGSDAVAASVILQDFLDTPEEQRVRC